MQTVADLADRYVEHRAAADPCWATGEGVGGHETELTDWSPGAIEQRAAFVRATLADLDAVDVTPDEEVAAAYLRERLTATLAAHESGDDLRDLSNLYNPPAQIRQAFDLMATDTVDDWVTIATRMEAVPTACRSIEEMLRHALDRHVLSARRQALVVAEQCATWARAYFADLVARAPDDAGLRGRLEAAAGDAGASFGALATLLSREYASAAPEVDAVGPDRYAINARRFLGTADLDVNEAFAWGWDELARIEAEMAATARQIVGSADVAAAEAALEADDSHALRGEDALRGWLQELIDWSIDELDGDLFDIAEPLRRCEAMIAPPGGAAAMYYSPPSEDFSRPGRTWYPTAGQSRFPIWREVSVCFHEAVPGHHLQLGTTRLLADRLNRHQRIVFVSGHGEGWALYAERLMDELGHLEDPAHRLGYLAAQAFRALRVVVDIGVHHQLEVPAGAGPHSGEVMTPEVVTELMLSRSHLPEVFARSEVDRYLGLPAQAISYKLGERVWLEGREAARRRPAFDPRAFHRDALALGPLGLDLLADELARL